MSCATTTPGACQLAVDCDLPAMAFPVQVEPKIDGCRCLVVCTASGATAYSRRGTVWHAVTSALPDLSRLAGWVMDCEVQFGGAWGPTNAAIHRRDLSPSEVAGMRLHVFDALTAAEYADGATSRPQSERTATVARLLRRIRDGRIVRVPSVVAWSAREVVRLHDRAVADGYEGVVCKRLDAGYAIGRQSHWQKVKATATEDWVAGGAVVEGRDGRVLRIRLDRTPDTL
jgi:bifunctional non-homologous end joining protein LigD